MLLRFVNLPDGSYAVKVFDALEPNPPMGYADMKDPQKVWEKPEDVVEHCRGTQEEAYGALAAIMRSLGDRPIYKEGDNGFYIPTSRG